MIEAKPALDGISPVSIEIVVVFPAPFSPVLFLLQSNLSTIFKPSKAKISPSYIVSVKFRTATWEYFPLLNSFRSSLIWIHLFSSSKRFNEVDTSSIIASSGTRESFLRAESGRYSLGLSFLQYLEVKRKYQGLAIPYSEILA